MNNDIKTVSPFKNFCVTIGNLPTSYLESMSYYEMLCWFCKYLENTINPAINSNAEALKELQEYVADYFSDLNVQTEIDNKLDEMVQDGTMAEIINQEIFDELSVRVTAVEEDTEDLQGQLQLSHIYTLDIDKLSGDTEIIDTFSNGTICWNNDGTWFKCFLYFRATNDGTTKYIRIPFPDGFSVSEAYTINNAGEVWTSSGSFYGTVNLYVGTTEFVILLKTNGTTFIKLNPYMYYNGVIES